MATTQNKDYYGTLGVKKTATAEEIRKAFSKAARRYHPDVNPGDKKAEEKFKEISEANDVLSDEKKRKVYDQVGFYSDQIDPAHGRGLCAAAGRGRAASGGLRRLRLLRLSERAGARSRAQQAGAGSAVVGQLQGHFFRHLFRGAAAAAAARPAAGHAISNTRPRWTSGRRFAAGRRASRCTARRSAPPATARRTPAGRCSARSATARAR